MALPFLAVAPLATAATPETGGATPVASQSAPGLAQLSERVDEVYRKACLSVVRVRSKAGLVESVTNGFFVGDGSVVATVFPSDDLPDSIVVEHGEQRYDARVAAFDERVRVGLLEAMGMLGTIVDLVPAPVLPTAARLYVVTEHHDPLARMVGGRLVGRVKMVERNMLPVSMLRVNLETTEGSIGAPVFTESGQAIGAVIVDVPEDPKSAYVLPSSVIHKVITDYTEAGLVRHGWIGITLEEGTTTPRVLECRPKSPAATAGLERGDIILRIGLRAVEEYQDVVDAIYYLKPGDATEVEFLRGLVRQSATIVPAERPPDAGRPKPDRSSTARGDSRTGSGR
jgi:S1-C subfamily serine protease